VLNVWIQLFSEVGNESRINRVTDLLANTAIIITKIQDDEAGDYYHLNSS
jgi:hypothetical protein